MVMSSHSIENSRFRLNSKVHIASLTIDYIKYYLLFFEKTILKDILLQLAQQQTAKLALCLPSGQTYLLHLPRRLCFYLCPVLGRLLSQQDYTKTTEQI